MHKIEKTDYGFRITFQGTISLEEMTNWVHESNYALSNVRSGFSCVIDMSIMTTLMPDVKHKLEEGQRSYLVAGMLRSCVLVPSRIVAMQLRNMATASGILKNERYVSVDTQSAYVKALAWASLGTEP